MKSSDMHHDQQLARTILDSLTAHVAILDESGFILETNRAWKRFAKQNQLRMRPETKEINYLEICENTDVTTDREGLQVAAGIRDVIAGRLDEFVLDYPCHSPDEKRWFYMRVTRAPGPGPVRIVVSHENITSLRETEIQLRQREEALEREKKKLEEANTALKVLLQRHKTQRREMEAEVIETTHRLIRPVVNRLSGMNLPKRASVLVESLDERIAGMTKPFLRHLSNVESLLTPQEIEIAAQIREGRSSKEIASLLNLSITTINFHRRNLRRKLNLSHTSTNLQTFLMGLTD
jgi:DNA-binding CsgD family transcriptional regulator